MKKVTRPSKRPERRTIREPLQRKLTAKPREDVDAVKPDVCQKHPQATLEFHQISNKWACPVPMCNYTKRPGIEKVTDEQVTIVKGEPRLVAKRDKDGDFYVFLWFEDKNVMVELPYSMTGENVRKSEVNFSDALEVVLYGASYAIMGEDNNPLSLKDL